MQIKRGLTSWVKRFPVRCNSVISRPPRIPLPPTLYLADSYECDEALREHVVGRGITVLGLDAEWKPERRKGQRHRTAVIQLCTGDVCLVLHLFHFNGPSTVLPEILADPTVEKVGVCVGDDAIRLHTDYGYHVTNLGELTHLALGIEVLAAAKGIPGMKFQRKGLAALAAHALGCEKVPKARSVQMSNWEKHPLTENQQYYAAADAYYSLKAHEVLSGELDVVRQSGSHSVVFVPPEPPQGWPSHLPPCVSHQPDLHQQWGCFTYSDPTTAAAAAAILRQTSVGDLVHEDVLDMVKAPALPKKKKVDDGSAAAQKSATAMDS